MFSVFKRKSKTKSKNNVSIDSNDIFQEFKTTSMQKIHPVFNQKSRIKSFNDEIERSIVIPDIYPTKLKSVTLPAVLTPNICVEDGRIEFVKTSASSTKSGNETTTDQHVLRVDRHQQTDDFSNQTESEAIDQLSKMEYEYSTLKKDFDNEKQLTAKLQKQLNKRETLLKDEEKKSEVCKAEAIRYKAKLRLLTHEYNRMEDAVRSLVVYKTQMEQLKQEKSTLTTSYENRIQHYQNTITSLNDEIAALNNKLAEQSAAISFSTSTKKNSSKSFSFDNETSSKTINQYDKCLDGIANQVVKALVAQKNLQQEITVLKTKIKELEEQNNILATLVFEFLYKNKKKEENVSLNSCDSEEQQSTDSSPNRVFNQTIEKQHFNSFNSGSLLNFIEVNNKDFADHDILTNIDSSTDNLKLSLSDKKRHQILTDLWKDWKSSEVTPQNIIKALSKVDRSFWVPPKRPATLNLKFPLKSFLKSSSVHKYSNVNGKLVGKNDEETGNESPESGNRDEGYSTMSSDVQCENAKLNNEQLQTETKKNWQTKNSATTKCLEDLKESLDEAGESSNKIENRKLILEDVNDPDIFYIPLNLNFGLHSRNSYPPTKAFYPLGFEMRSFSDSHLCLNSTSISSAVSPIYSISSPLASSPSYLQFDAQNRNSPSLRKEIAKKEFLQHNKTKSGSCLQKHSETAENFAENCLDFVRNWLKDDDEKSHLMIQQKRLFDVEYDRTELEDWSFSLSSDDWPQVNSNGKIQRQKKRLQQQNNQDAELITPGGDISSSTLPSIQESNNLELEEDSNEFLWNGSSYMNQNNNGLKTQWPYEKVTPTKSKTIDLDCKTDSPKQVVLLNGSGANNETVDSNVGFDFTRDFYKLSTYESNKSLDKISQPNSTENFTETTNNDTIEERTDYAFLNCSNNDQKRTANGSEIEPEENSDPIRKSSNKVTEDKKDNSCSILEKSSHIPVFNKSEKFKRKPLTNDNKPIINGETSRIPRRNKSNISSIQSLQSPKSSVASKNTTSSLAMQKISDKKSGETKIPRKQQKTNNQNNSRLVDKISGSKIPISLNHSLHSDSFHIIDTCATNTHAMQENIKHNNKTDGNILNFSEAKTSKQLIDQLNEMIDESNESLCHYNNHIISNKKLDRDCKPTSWVRLRNEIDLNNPKARANLLDVMLASSDSSPTSSYDDRNDFINDLGRLKKVDKDSSTSAPCTPMTETMV